MSFPPFNVESKKTWAGNQSGGIQQTTRTSGLKLLNSSSSGPDQMPTMNENWLPQQQPKIFEFMAGNLTDESQMRYRQWDLLFFKSPDRFTPNQGYAMFSIPNLNYVLEMAQRNFLKGNQLLELEQQPGMTLSQIEQEKVGHKRKFSPGDGLDAEPLTAREFASIYHLAGSMYSSTEKKNVRKRNLGVVMEGRVTMANIFGPVKVGDQVGLSVKQIENTYTSFVDLNGRSIGDPTPGKILQVRGHYEPQSISPIHCSRKGAPRDNDLDYWDHEARVLARKVGSTPITSGDPNSYRLLNWNKVSSGQGNFYSKPWQYSSYEQGYYIPLGRVQFVNKIPTKELVELAHRSFEHYGQLLAESSVEVVIEQNPVNQLTVL